MIVLTQLVYVYPGKEAAFEAFEERALPLIAKHGGELLLRLRPSPDSWIAGSMELPYELHVVRFPDEEALESFSADEERRSVLPMKEESVRSSVLVRGALV